MIHQRQTRGTNCGQTCMATLLQWSVDLVEKTMRCKGKTSYAKLRTFLKGHTRFKLGPTTRIWTEKLPSGIALMRLTFNQKESHWVILSDGIIFDPAIAGPLALSEWFAIIPMGSRITSFARVQ